MSNKTDQISEEAVVDAYQKTHARMYIALVSVIVALWK